MFQGRRRATLRRVSPERARLTSRAPRRRTVPQAAEKLLVAALTSFVLVVALGVGRGLDLRSWVGLAAWMVVASVLYVRYLVDFRLAAFEALGATIALALLIVGTLVAARATEAVFGVEALAFFPLSLVSLVLALLWNRALALEVTVFTSFAIMSGLLLEPPARLGPGLLAFGICSAGAVTACLTASQVRRRTSLLRVGILTGCVLMLVFASQILIFDAGGMDAGEARRLLLLGAWGVTGALLVSGLLPVIEALFHITTDISLLELGNTQEQPLLRKLLVEAPGTFHHSYIVGLLSESAAEAVGANALLARVGSLYHDVGKLNKPEYFAENSPQARERHKGLTPEMSTLVLSSHPRDGVELGNYYGLPQSLLSFMTEHHGTSCVEYFFTQAKALRGEENVAEENFRYPGPRPRSVETAIVMLADAVEAIARQMPDPNRTRLAEMVHEVTLKRLLDRQFDECPITLRDLERIEAAFVRVLLGIYHTRPTYPKGRPHPLDLAQSVEARRRAVEEAAPRGQSS